MDIRSTKGLTIMIRRDLFRSGLLFAASGVSSRSEGADSQPGFPGTRYRQYSRCLPGYLSNLAGSLVRQREAALARLTSPTAIRARQTWARDTLWTLLGGRYEKTPLNAHVTGSIGRTNYRVDKIVYESRPNLFVTANLYGPTQGGGPFPAVLFQSGHYWEGKAFPSYQRFCHGLAQLGFVVLAFEPMGQGERIDYPDDSGLRSRLPDCDSEHTTPGKQLLLLGDSTTRYQLWDAIRSLDYLLSLPFVDSRRVASTGHSGGGTLTMLLAAADDRLAAAAVCMGNAENVAASPFVPPGATDDAEQNFVYSGPAGFDRWDLLYPFAPKPMLILPSDRDFLATYSSQYIRNGWEEYRKLKSVYERMSQPGHLSWADTPLPHALAYDSRLLFYNWFTRWLKPGSPAVTEEPPVSPEPVAELWATESGSVVRSLNSATPFSIIQTTLTPTGKTRRDRASLESLLKLTRPSADASARRIGQVTCRHIRVEVLEVQPGPEVWLPAFLLVPEKTVPNQPVLLVLDDTGSDRLWFNPEVDRTVAEDAPVICAADLRGVGVLTPAFSPGMAGYAAWHQQEENYAWGSLILGKPLVGQRVTDILAWTAALRRYPATAGRPVHVAARGRLTVPALFAAALEPQIQKLYLAGGLVSFRNVVETEIYNYPFANFVPDLLNHTDLPEIAAALAPRHVTLAGSVDATGAQMSAASVRTIYAAAHGAGNLSIVESADWSASGLISLATARHPE